MVTDCRSTGQSAQEPARAGVAQAQPAALARGRREARRGPPHGLRGPAGAERAAGVRLDPGHLRLARGGADAVRPLHPRHRRARGRHPADRRELLAGRRQPARQRRHPRLPGEQAGHQAARADGRGQRGGRGLPGGHLREELRGRARDLPRADADRAAGIALHLARLPADPGPEPDLHGLVLAGHAGRRLHRERRTGRSTSSTPATSSPSTRTSGPRTSSRSSRTRTGRSPTGARRATSCSGTRGRNAIDVYKVTLPAPPKPRTASTEAAEPLPGTPTFPVSETRGVEQRADAARVREHIGVRGRARDAARTAQARSLLVLAPQRRTASRSR